MTSTGQRALAALTAKEQALLAAVCEGKTNREIAIWAETTEQVIKNRLGPIFDKTGTSHRTELVVFAFYHGMVICPCTQQKRDTA